MIRLNSSIKPVRVYYTMRLVPSVLIMVYHMGRKLFEWNVLFKTHVTNNIM